MKVNPELLPLVEWWEKDGKQTVLWLVVAAIAVGGWYGWKGYRAARANASRAAFVNAETTEDLEAAVGKFASSDNAGVLKIRLAKSYYDNGSYESALSLYEEVSAKAPDGFGDIAVVGKAQCLEALGKSAEALKAYDDFAKANPQSYLAQTAQLGKARMLVKTGDKKGALAVIEALKKDAKDDPIAKMRVEAAEELVNRFGKPAASPAPVAKPAAPAAKPAAPVAKPAAPAAKPATPAAKPAAPVAKPENKKATK